MSSIACARAARRLPSSSRSGGRTYPPARKAAPRAAERAGDDERGRPGRAPARPGTRSDAADRGHAENDRRGRGRVAAGDRHAGLGDPRVELVDVVCLRLGRERER